MYNNKINTLNDILESLNEQQKRVVISNEQNILVVACPGSGKTHTVISRYIHLVSKQNIDPQEIILITFTKKAGMELKQRINKYLPDKLPYYDVFPLVIPIKRLSDGFLGINFHYLSIPLRIKLLERIEPMAKEGRMLGWGRISKIKLIQPCIKRYLKGQVGSRFLTIDKEDFLLASLLPVQSFKKETWQTVHRRSRSMIY